MAITGGCLCRAVRYTIAAEPIGTRVCWCRDCQYFAAGSATVNVIFPASALTITGPLRDYASDAQSGNRMRRQFCEQCGSPVTSAADVRPQVIIVRAGTLDDPKWAQPSMTIWTDSAPTWANIDESLPQCPKQAPPAG